MDLKKLSMGEMVTGAAGILLLIFSFFNWYSFGGGSIDVGGVDVDIPDVPGASLSGWDGPDGFLSVVAILIGIAMAAYVILTKLAGVELPDKLGNVGMGFVLFIAGAVAFVFVLLKWLLNTEGPEKFGLYASLVSSAGLAVGGFLIAKERGHLPASMGGSSAGGGGAPRPPAA